MIKIFLVRCEGFEDWRYSIQNVDGSSVIRHHGIQTKRTKPVQSIEDIDWENLYVTVNPNFVLYPKILKFNNQLTNNKP